MKSLCQSKNSLNVVAIVSTVFLLGIMMSGSVFQNVYAHSDHDGKHGDHGKHGKHWKHWKHGKHGDRHD